MSKILTDREAIRQWAEARGGNPVLQEIPDGSRTRTILQLAFGTAGVNAFGDDGSGRPGGFELVSWDDWFAALEANRLALLVSDDPSGGNEAEYGFVERD